jgi:arylsulfatase A-like enzyme
LFRGYKAGMFEGGIRMPALLSFPARIKTGQVVSEVGAAMDIAPAFQSMAGLGAQATDMDGADLTGMLTRAEKPPHNAIFWGCGKQRAVRAGEWKLIENPPQFPGEPVSDPVWLSNLAEDPGETRNLAAAEPGHVARLKAMLAAWEKRVGG